MTAEHTFTTVNVLTQNILLDKTRTKKGLILPQEKRIATIATTLDGFDDSLDVVGIQEAHKSGFQHNGEALAEMTGFGSGFWLAHNEKPYSDSPTGRSGEYVGIFGEMVDHAWAIELGDRRRALVTDIAGVAFATLHLRFGYTMEKRLGREEQAHNLTDGLATYDSAVIFGDFNEPPLRYLSRGRDALHDEGFKSVFTLMGERRPKTNPVYGYRDIVTQGHGWKANVMKRGMSIDDIMVRGDRIRVLGAGVLERPAFRLAVPPKDGSDHEGLWAKLAIQDE